jgi:hypothetical protein
VVFFTSRQTARLPLHHNFEGLHLVRSCVTDMASGEERPMLARLLVSGDMGIALLSLSDSANAQGNLRVDRTPRHSIRTRYTVASDGSSQGILLVSFWGNNDFSRDRVPDCHRFHQDHDYGHDHYHHKPRNPSS